MEGGLATRACIPPPPPRSHGLGDRRQALVESGGGAKSAKFLASSVRLESSAGNTSLHGSETFPGSHSLMTQAESLRPGLPPHLPTGAGLGRGSQGCGQSPGEPSRLERCPRPPLRPRSLWGSLWESVGRFLRAELPAEPCKARDHTYAHFRLVWTACQRRESPEWGLAPLPVLVTTSGTETGPRPAAVWPDRVSHVLISHPRRPRAPAAFTTALRHLQGHLLFMGREAGLLLLIGRQRSRLFRT